MLSAELTVQRDEINVQFVVEQAHKHVFVSLIEEKILHQQEIMHPSDLCRYYTEFLAGRTYLRDQEAEIKASEA